MIAMCLSESLHRPISKLYFYDAFLLEKVDFTIASVLKFVTSVVTKHWHEMGYKETHTFKNGSLNFEVVIREISI